MSSAPPQVRELVERFEPRAPTLPVVPRQQAALQRQIDTTDRQIDRLVYELYGLTEEEIKIVEEATRA